MNGHLYRNIAAIQDNQLANFALQSNKISIFYCKFIWRLKMIHLSQVLQI